MKIILFVFIVFLIGRAGKKTWLDPNTPADFQRRKVFISKYYPPRSADINGDGTVNFFDLAELAAKWLQKGN